MNRIHTKKLVFMALLTAIVLTIFVLEAQIPPLAPIPGIKLGLANIVTIYAVFVLGAGPAAMILLSRIILGSLFSGGMTIFYSLTGGFCCYLMMLVMRKLVTEKQIWVCSVLGAVAHNIGQIIAAVFITQTPGVAAYLPVLLVSGILTGLFTGLCARFLLQRIRGHAF